MELKEGYVRVVGKIRARLYQKQNVAALKAFLYRGFNLCLVGLHNFLVEGLFGVEFVGIEGKYERLYGKAVLDL